GGEPRQPATDAGPAGRGRGRRRKGGGPGRRADSSTREPRVPGVKSPREAAVQDTPGEGKVLSYCGCCTGHAETWCPECFGFTGCDVCGGVARVPCPDCADGKVQPIPW